MRILVPLIVLMNFYSVSFGLDTPSISDIQKFSIKDISTMSFKVTKVEPLSGPPSDHDQWNKISYEICNKLNQKQVIRMGLGDNIISDNLSVSLEPTFVRGQFMNVRMNPEIPQVFNAGECLSGNIAVRIIKWPIFSRSVRFHLGFSVDNLSMMTKMTKPGTLWSDEIKILKAH